MAAMVQHTWPGNIRELENAIERAIVLADGTTLELKILILEYPGPRIGVPGITAMTGFL
jgi:DNA-binding NtrC family response regulator